MKIISSRDNPIIKQVRSLKEKKYRQQHGLFVIEGHKLVQEALANGHLVHVLVSEDCETQYDGEAAASPELDWYCLEERVFAQVADTSHPQGIIATARIPLCCLEDIPQEKNAIWLYLDHINDPGNLGSIFRSGWAMGIGAVLVSPDCADPFNPKVVRAAAGAILALPMIKDAGVDQLAALKEQGFQVAGADIRGAEPYYQFSYRHPLILAIGSEAHGLSPEVKALCDQVIYIPMQNGAESLNASVATAIILADHARRYIEFGKPR